MKKMIFAGIALLTLASCANKAMMNECSAIAEKEMTEMDGFTVRSTNVDPVEGLKLVIPDEFITAEYVASVSYKSEDGDYKSCTCYFNGSNKLIGFDAK